jgi:class 3 adenylate cyclase/tetratricopeptide (TPR) repeat protein
MTAAFGGSRAEFEHRFELPACGTTIGDLMVCPACLQSVPEGARFCPACGTALSAADDLGRGDLLGDEERRVVTVLFADLVGFTSLAEHRDPEQVKRLVDTVFEQLVADVETHGGVVDKVLGDAILALFGAPIAHEDDADRAVRAGLAMQATLRAFRDENPDDDVRMRVGVNTGEVLVGTLAGTDYTAMGDVVNTAARLQELAPIGTVLVGDATKQLCSPVLRFQAFDAVQLRGREQSTQVWRAISLDSGADARHRAPDVAFVGRQVELGMLEAVTSIVRSGRSAIVAVAGEPGIGKSRLVREAIAPLIEERPDSLVLEGACAPYGESNVWWPVAGGFVARLGLDRNQDPVEARERTIRRIERIGVIEPGTQEFDRAVELVLHLLGMPSALDELGPVATRDAVIAGFVAAIARRAASTPVVIWIDDLQWAAPLLLELLEAIGRQLAGFPVLVVATYRSDHEHTADWPPPVDPALTLHLSLEPLDATESAELVANAAGADLPERVLSGISARSGGNPLFLIELARLAAASDDATSAALPGSLRALIAARIDQLTATQRAVLDNAAIIGNAGRVSSLRDFSRELGQEYDPDDVRQLDERGLLVREGTRWRFRSDVVREVAYHTLTKQARAQRHAGVARYLAAYEPTLVDRRAHHLASAAELRAELGPIPGVPDDIASEAVDTLIAAARHWADQGAHRRGLQVVERSLALCATSAAARREALLVRAEALVEVHEHQRARSSLAELSSLADASGDLAAGGEAARLLGTIEQRDGDLVAARRELGRAVEVFRELGDEARLAESLRARGFAEIFGGSLADAEWFLGEADDLFERTGNARGRAWVHQNRAWVSFLSGDHETSERRLQDAISEFEQLDDRAGRAWSYGLLAYVFHFNRRNDEALELAVTALEDARRWEDNWGASMMLNLQASIRLWRGEVAEARELSERALAGFRRIDDRFGMIQALGTINRASVALGRIAEAERTVEEVLVLSDAFGELAYPAIAAAGTAMHLGRGERAAELATEAIERLDTTGANVDEGRVVIAFGLLLTGRDDEALARLVDVDVERSPFALAARATARAAIGDRDGALEDVRAVEAMPEVSYWDRAIAAVAGAIAATGDEAAHRRSALADLVERIDDVMVSAYAADVLGRLDPTLPDDAEPGGDRRAPGPPPMPIGGWRDLAGRLVVACS